MKTIIIHLFLFVTVLLLINCGGSQSDITNDVVKGIPVNIITANTGSIENIVKFFGNVKAEQAVTIHSTIPNRIVKQNADIGDFVAAGDILAVIDSEKIFQAVTQAEASLEVSKAQYRTAKAEWDRAQRLYVENVVSQSHYESIQAQHDAAASNVKQLEAVLSTAQSQLNDAEISSPITGVISYRALDVGDVAVPQIPLFKVVKMDPVRVHINVIERNVGKIQIGQKARIIVDSYPGIVFWGKVALVNPTLDPMSRTSSAEIKVENTDLKLKPGMFARVEVITDIHENIIVIPKHIIVEKTALQYEEGRLSAGQVKVNKFVFVVKDSLALKHTIETGYERGNDIEILSGIDPGVFIVSRGQHQLIDSSKVEIINTN